MLLPLGSKPVKIHSVGVRPDVYSLVIVVSFLATVAYLSSKSITNKIKKELDRSPQRRPYPGSLFQLQPTEKQMATALIYVYINNKYIPIHLIVISRHCYN